ncbi:unnamed protein product [Effrenium voratum]|nr:unnamed protein product [Effrenium voratum]CAJ1416212.1 unnamed protein product [Effrenium voratum]
MSIPDCMPCRCLEHLFQSKALLTRRSCVPSEESRFVWGKLLDDSQSRFKLCQVLAAQGYALLEVPGSFQESVRQMQGLAEEFFRRPREERCAVGRLRLYRDKVVGYREMGGGFARFLEVHALAGGGAIPNPKVPGLVRLSAELHKSLQAMARKLITWLAEHCHVPPEALLQCIDQEGLENLEDGDCSASVLRLCSYGLEACAEEEASHAVFFDEHTDSSFLTLAPVGSAPGLQFRDRDERWLDVESGLAKGECLVVFVGDFLEVLTKGTYAAARHRVCKDTEGRTQRFSMPFLVRGQPTSTIDTVPFLKDDIPLLQVEGVRYSEMRQFLDLKGRRRFSGNKLLEKSP